MMSNFSAEGLAAKDQVESLPEADKKELATDLASQYGFIPATEANKMRVLMKVIPVLAAVVLIALVGGLILNGLDKDAAAAYTIASLVAGGLVGIFVPSPQQK